MQARGNGQNIMFSILNDLSLTRAKKIEKRKFTLLSPERATITKNYPHILLVNASRVHTFVIQDEAHYFNCNHGTFNHHHHPMGSYQLPPTPEAESNH
jgi:hypothetical protein